MIVCEAFAETSVATFWMKVSKAKLLVKKDNQSNLLSWTFEKGGW
jgi:hypothetical protein